MIVNGYTIKPRAELEAANLTGANLEGARLAGANLTAANLTGANLCRTSLHRTSLRGAKLKVANLSGADLYKADLRIADLTGANLTGAKLEGAKLGGAKLQGCIGDMRYVKTMRLERWEIVYTSDILRIGCEKHAIEDWWSFSDDQIDRMDPRALVWWKKFGPMLRQIIETSPAEPTGGER